MVKDGLEEAFDRAFKQFEREVIAGFGSYDMPLASASSGTLRGRILGNGDGEIEIDLPDDGAGAATVAAHEAAGVIVRPHIDAAAAESVVEGETRVLSDHADPGISRFGDRCTRGLAGARVDGNAGGTGARRRAAAEEGSQVAVTITAAELAEAIGTDSATATRFVVGRDGIGDAVRAGRAGRDCQPRGDPVLWLARGAPRRGNHERNGGRHSDQLCARYDIRASTFRRDGLVVALEDPPGGRDMIRRLALRRFPNEVVRRRQGPGDFTPMGNSSPGRSWRPFSRHACCRCRLRTRTSPAG